MRRALCGYGYRANHRPTETNDPLTPSCATAAPLVNADAKTLKPDLVGFNAQANQFTDLVRWRQPVDEADVSSVRMYVDLQVRIGSQPVEIGDGNNHIILET